MLQKIIVVILGFFVSIVGALAPSGLFASTSLEGEVGLMGGFSEETLATVDASGRAFTRVNVLWIEVDGFRVTDEAWGTGSVKELKFKVGVKDVDDKALVIGDKTVALRATDIVTIRMFQGDFAYRDVGPTGATLQLQGQVKTTLVKEGAATTKVRTEVGGLAGDATQASRAGATRDASLAYVVLDTGARVDTVAVVGGGSRLFTEESATAAQAKQEPGNLLAKWVKINGQVVREYTWGEGTVERIEFEPAESSARSVVVSFNGQASEALAGQKVHVKDFVGEYTVYQVAGGLVRLRLDGYAATYGIGDEAHVVLPLGGTGAPNAAFDYFPPNPRTTDTIHFTDRSTDDGIIVFTVWNFGDEGASVLQNPTHRFRVPGDYVVALTVTDDGLKTSTVTRTITVRNADPVPDFDFSPKIVTSGSLVTFTDRSFDSDGSVTQWSWDFGDGNVSSARNPSHRFPLPGNQTITLTVKDELGATASISKLIIVRNAPPVAAFSYTHDNAPAEPMSQIPVQFVDESTDRDGHIAEWRWNFGDGSSGSGSNPVHAFPRPGLYTVSLTVFDNKGDKASTSQQVRVLNRPAIVDFVYTPETPVSNTPISFRSTSHDPDGSILYQEWTFTDGTRSLGATATHAFPRAGTYWVNLSVIDSSAERSWLNKTVTIENSAPSARFTVSPSPALRSQNVQFHDVSIDPDGDDIVAWQWSFGDGNTSTLRHPVHTYQMLGVYTVTLNVSDVHGHYATASGPLTILNARPLIDILTIEPRTVRAAFLNETIYFNATARDPDSAAPVEYRWVFADGTFVGRNITRTFPTAGDRAVTLYVKDADGGETASRSETFSVTFAPPTADFLVNPAAPTTHADVSFTDVSWSPNGAIVAWRWDFGDGTTSTVRNPVHRYVEHGHKTVRLVVTDAHNREAEKSSAVVVNGLPTSLFTMDRSGVIPLHTAVTFTDLSTDPEGGLAKWTWNYGDGVTEAFTVSTNPVHTFTTPGPKTITLTVEDSQGATHTSQQVLTVENRAPRASFTYAPQPPLARNPVQFQSTASDPDGTPLTSWTWTFGEGGTSNVEHPSHTFLSSGTYVVTLRVSDGVANSPVDSDAYKLLRVGSPDAFEIRMSATLPDGRSVRLSDPDVVASVSVMKGTQTLVHIPKSQLVVSGDDLVYTLSPGQWARGERIVLSVRNATFQSSAQTFSYNVTTDSVTSLAHSFVLSMPLVATIDVDAGQDALLPLLGSDRTTSGIPVYRQPFEHIHGNGTVRFFDGLAASNAAVRIEMRYLPLSTFRGTTLDDTPVLSDLRGWCEVANVRTQADGSYAWSGRTTLCISGGLPMAPGVYEVRGVASFANAMGAYTPATRFIVDPTGVIVPLAETLLG